MRAKVALLARVKVGKRYPFLPVEIKRNNPVPVEGASYYLRYSQDGEQVVQPVGLNIETAYAAYQNRELNFTRNRLGLPKSEKSEPSRVLISDAVEKFTADLESDVLKGKKSKATLLSYRNAVETFRDHCSDCGVRLIHEITADVLKQHETWLFKKIQRRKHGDQINTIANRFRFLSVFLAKNGIKMSKAKNATPDDKGLLDWSDMPHEKEKEFINKYSEDELNALLAVSDDDEADLIHTFLRTGCRDEEVVYLHWTDINFKRQEVKISEKPRYGWKVKDRESRIIPVNDGVLMERLSLRKQRQSPKSHLVFPNTLGEPDQHLIRRLRKVAKRAGEKGFAFEGEVNLHRFRRTYASMMIAHSDLQTVSELLGHEDIETTVGYLSPDRSKARKASESAFKAIK
jgi:integrase